MATGHFARGGVTGGGGDEHRNLAERNIFQNRQHQQMVWLEAARARKAGRSEQKRYCERENVLLACWPDSGASWILCPTEPTSFFWNEGM